MIWMLFTTWFECHLRRDLYAVYDTIWLLFTILSEFYLRHDLKIIDYMSHDIKAIDEVI